MNEDCKHDRVYSGECYATMPPKWHWLCTKCGKDGADAHLPTFEIERYLNAYQKFNPDGDPGTIAVLRARLAEEPNALVEGMAMDDEVPEPVRVTDLYLISDEPMPAEAEGLMFTPPAMPIRRPGAGGVAKPGALAFSRDPHNECRAVAYPQCLFRTETIAAWGDVKLLSVKVGLRLVAEGADLLDEGVFEKRLKSVEVGQTMSLHFSGPAPPCLALGITVW